MLQNTKINKLKQSFFFPFSDLKIIFLQNKNKSHTLILNASYPFIFTWKNILRIQQPNQKKQS